MTPDTAQPTTDEADEWECSECGRTFKGPKVCPKCVREELTEQTTPNDSYAESGE